MASEPGMQPKPELLVALTLHRSGALPEAEAMYRQVLLTDPNDEQAHHLLGVIAHQGGRDEEAARLMRRAVELAPRLAAFRRHLASVLGAIGCHREAERELRESLRLKPDWPEALNTLGSCLERLDCFDEAIAALQRAVALQPGYVDAWVNLSNVLRKGGRDDDSLTAARRATVLADDCTAAHLAVGEALRELCRPREAIEAFDAALRAGPGNREAERARAEALLSMGDLPGGFRAFESRRWHPAWQRDLAAPLWDGSEANGRTILLYAEGGLGDTIQFVRYAPLLAGRGARVIFECQPALMELLRSVKGIDKLVAIGEELPRYDAYAPLMGLPYLFGTTLESVPAAVPYLSSDPAQVEKWRGYFGRPDARALTLPSPSGRGWASGEGQSDMTVGVCWRGEQVQGGRERSIPLTEFAPLGAIPGVRLIGLQTTPETQSRRAGTVPHSFIAVPGGLNDCKALVEVAAVMHRMDLIIACDCPLAHLAGAMGVPVWMALDHAPCWRWMLDREDSPWYPTMRLFRQTRRGDWAGVFERMAEELRRLQQTGMSAAPQQTRMSAPPEPRVAPRQTRMSAPPQRGTSAPPVLDYFDRAYVLNLDADADRMGRAAARLARLGITYERFAAIVPAPGLKSKDPRFTAAYYACGLSHRTVLQLAYDRGEERILIFEDDVVLRDDAAQWMQRIVPQLREVSWDVFYLGLRLEKGSERCGPNLLRVERGFHAHAYAIARRAIPKLVAIIDGVLTRMTGTFDGFEDPSLLKVCADPILAIQEPNHSHTHGRWIDRVGEHLAAFDADEFLSHRREPGDLSRNISGGRRSEGLGICSDRGVISGLCLGRLGTVSSKQTARATPCDGQERVARF